MATERAKSKEIAASVEELSRMYRGGYGTLAPALSMLLHLEGKPFSLERYPQMETMYRLHDQPRRQIWRCARQVSKTTNLAAKTSVESVLSAYHRTLCVSPLFQQAQRVSTQSFDPLLTASPITPYVTANAVGTKKFSNGSQVFFINAFLDAERARGISAHTMVADEIQDIDMSFLPILEACLTAAAEPCTAYYGTPKTLDNTIEVEFNKSSQAHWGIRCGCGHWNIASVEYDLREMVQDKGLACAKCCRPLDAMAGRWIHSVPSLAQSYPGYHVPQPILPLHYAEENKWAALLTARDTYPEYQYLNEILGEPCDTGARLITRSDTAAAAVLPWDISNGPGEALQFRNRYQRVYIGVDWALGAGGKIKMRRGKPVVVQGTSSYTAIAVIGFTADPTKPELLYGEIIPSETPIAAEQERVKQLYAMFRASVLAHDYGGAGHVRDGNLRGMGFNDANLVGMSYVQSTVSPILFPLARANSVRKTWNLDKTRSLSLVCGAIKSKRLALPRVTEASKKLYDHFSALIETTGSNGQYMIQQVNTSPSDFAHAMNLACITGWKAYGILEQMGAMYSVAVGGREEVWDE